MLFKKYSLPSEVNIIREMALTQFNLHYRQALLSLRASSGYEDGKNCIVVEKVFQEVIGVFDGTIPYKVSPRVLRENVNPEFKEDLIESMCKSNTYYYFGVDMTIASLCIKKCLRNSFFP